MPLLRRAPLSLRLSTLEKTRNFHPSPAEMVTPSDLSAAKGEDLATLAEHATSLVDHGRWSLCNGGKGLEREFRFKTFKAAWDFMNTVAAECKKQKHHPEWTNVYNKTHIRWTTHNPLGLSGKDTAMARFCDEAGEEGGEVVVEGRGEGGVETGRMEVGDCCGGGGKKGV